MLGWVTSANGKSIADCDALLSDDAWRPRSFWKAGGGGHFDAKWWNKDFRIGLAYTGATLCLPCMVLPLSETYFAYSARTNQRLKSANSRPINVQEYRFATNQRLKISNLRHRLVIKSNRLHFKTRPLP